MHNDTGDAVASAAVPLPTAEQVKGRRKAKRNINEQHQESLTTLERLATWITNHIGTMGFFIIILCWTVLWLGWNLLAPARLRFDPGTGFVFWLFISNMIQILLMPLIMVGQNLQGRHSEMRAEQEFNTTQQTEHEVEIVLRYLEAGHEALKEMDKRLEALEKRLASPGS